MYQVLYRKWRPQTLADVVGQPSITAALQNELKTGRMAHAYLFTGSRGTGKTSCAKILAKAVNCRHPVDGEPCNDCDLCRGIDAGSIPDVVEIDAASNNGVDNIRDLREEVRFSPAVAAYRVYIIDEVHMLSAGAFNALLKTLEEPPPQVLFILATTEVHKLPATIVSRCQRFDFQRIAPEAIAARLQYVAGQEQFSLTDDAALLIARLADGGMRDALSLLDQCAARAREVTAAVVAQAAGLTGRDPLFALSRAIRGRDSGEALRLLGDLYSQSLDMERLCTELMELFRQLMLVRSTPRPEELIVVPPAEWPSLREEAAAYTLPVLLHVIDVLQETLIKLRGGVSRRLVMEMALLRLCAPELDDTPAALLCRLEAVESRLRAGSLPAASAAVTSPASAASPKPEGPLPRATTPSLQPPVVPDSAPPAAAPEEPPATVSPAPAPQAAPLPTASGEQPFAAWRDVVDTLAATCPPLHGVLAQSTAVLRGDMVLVQTDSPLFKALVTRDGNRETLIAAIRGVTGQTYRIGVRLPPAAPAAEDAPEDALSSLVRRSRELGVDVHLS